MFESVVQKKTSNRKHRWLGFVLGSAAVNGLLILGAYWLVPQKPLPADELEVPVAFALKTVEAEAPVEEAPPPPPPPAPTRPRSASAASSGTGGKRVRRALEAPSAIPDAPPSAVDPVRPPEPEGGTGGESHAGPDSAPAAPLAESGPSPSRSGPRVVQVNDDLEGPMADPSNRMPEYPESARIAGKEGLVEVRIAVEEEGTVKVLEVRRGEDPFVSVVLAVIPGWRFAPARLDGIPVAVHRVVRVPFRLQR